MKIFLRKCKRSQIVGAKTKNNKMYIHIIDEYRLTDNAPMRKTHK